MAEFDPSYLFDVHTVIPKNFSADGTRLLVSSDVTGDFEVYAYPVEGGEPSRLTRSRQGSAFAVSFFPHDDRYLFESDAMGDEVFGLYVGGRGEAHSVFLEGSVNFLGWSRDGARFFVGNNGREASAFDVYAVSAADYSTQLLFENDGTYFPVEVSPEGDSIAVEKPISGYENTICLVRRPGPEAVVVCADNPGQSYQRHLAFTPDGTRLIGASDEAGEFMVETCMTVADLRPCSPGTAHASSAELVGITFSLQGGAIARTFDEEGVARVQVDRGEGTDAIELHGLPARAGVRTLTFDRTGQQLALMVESDTHATALWVADMRTGQARPIVEASVTPPVGVPLPVSSEHIRFESFDGLEIPALVYRSRAASEASPGPAIVWVHGGPGGESRVEYNPTIQALLAAGYTVLAVNNRGSSGYGKTFEHLDDRRHGDHDLRDCVWARRYLATLAWIDGDRVAIMGPSYGGYLTVAALTFFPDEFAAGIDIFGVTNWIRTLSAIPESWGRARDIMHAEIGHPQRDATRLREISPLFHADAIRRPLMVVQGANDPRVLEVESKDLVDTLERNGVPHEYLLFPDEGHGFRNRDNRIRAARAYVSFLDAHMKAR